MGAFRAELRRRNPDPSGRRWLFVPYDQLCDRIGPLSREDPRTLGIVVLETSAKGRRRPYHPQKLALVLANLRHFALEQAERGVAVIHRAGPQGYAELLREVAARTGPMRLMEPAERELRVELAPLVSGGLLEVLPHEGWLTPPDALERSQAGPPWRMDPFYRWIRKRTGILMEGGKPLGGRFSFDAENREPWPGEPPPAVEPTFPLDPVKEEVLELVSSSFGEHWGELRPEHLPATAADAGAAWRWAREACLPRFGPFEDAMSVRSTTLFHTRISALLNLHRILPREVVDDALALDLPLASREGFIRQVLGWREFVRHVHRATEGFRKLPPEGPAGDGSRPDAPLGHPAASGVPAGAAAPSGASPGASAPSEAPATPSFLDAHDPLPPVYWGTPSGLRCLDTVVADVHREGYSHHITRLMVLSNLATLLGVEPREITDWFWVAYTDAYDWVVEPNVLGMGTYAAGDLMTTKPYVSGAAYLRRMGDYCDGCTFDPRATCPVTPLYWAFLDRNREALEGNRRMALPLASAAKRSPERRERDRETARRVRERLQAGERVGLEDVEP